MLRRWLPHLPAAIAILFVLTVYAFLASDGTFDFPRRTWDHRTEKIGEGYYSSLAEGFRLGRLSMMEEPDPRLKAVHDPYRREVRDKETSFRGR